MRSAQGKTSSGRSIYLHFRFWFRSYILPVSGESLAQLRAVLAIQMGESTRVPERY